jgi:hypothetical protein
MPATEPRNLVHLHRDRGYRFVEQDPALAEINRLITDSGLSITEICLRVRRLTFYGISPQTISNWQSGKVRRPQNWTLTWVARALGYRRTFTKIKDK